MSNLEISLNALLTPMVDGHPGEPQTVMQGGPKPVIVIEFEDDGEGNENIGERVGINLRATGLEQQQVAYFLHELAHMMLEPDTTELISVPMSAVAEDGE